MGQRFSIFFTGLGRFFEYPVKRKPICFYRQEDFTATGELKDQKSQDKKTKPEDMTAYDVLVATFYERLLRARREAADVENHEKRWSVHELVKRFSGWNELTIANLHSLFLLFDSERNGMLRFDDFCAILESLGDVGEMELRKSKFTEADMDKDGWITYDEFLLLLYNFDAKVEGKLSGLPLLCYEVAEKINFVNSLTVGEQLEYGLF